MGEEGDTDGGEERDIDLDEGDFESPQLLEQMEDKSSSRGMRNKKEQKKKKKLILVTN